MLEASPWAKSPIAAHYHAIGNGPFPAVCLFTFTFGSALLILDRRDGRPVAILEEMAHRNRFQLISADFSCKMLTRLPAMERNRWNMMLKWIARYGKATPHRRQWLRLNLHLHVVCQECPARNSGTLEVRGHLGINSKETGSILFNHIISFNAKSPAKSGGKSTVNGHSSEFAQEGHCKLQRSSTTHHKEDSEHQPPAELFGF